MSLDIYRVCKKVNRDYNAKSYRELYLEKWSPPYITPLCLYFNSNKLMLLAQMTAHEWFEKPFLRGC